MVVFAVLSAVSPLAAQKAHIDFDHSSDFSHYKTYQWAGPPDADSLNQLMQERMVGFVEEALAAKHLRRVKTGGDLLVDCRVNVKQQEVYTTFGDGGFGWYSGWGGGITTTTTQVIQLGTLTVDVVDSRRNQLVFEGVSTAPISSKPAHNTKRLAKAVNEIFEKYPPR
jgi:hypothetical protein